MKIVRGSLFISLCLAVSPGAMQHTEAAEQPYQVEWTAQIGTASYDNSFSVAVDAAGNAFISGYTEGSLGGTNAGDVDGFLTKFDPTGAELWSTQIGSTRADGSYAVAVDTTGNAYISGWTHGNLVGGYGAFLTKYDPLGSELWTRGVGFGGSTSVAVDATGNAYISGWSGYGDNSNAFVTKFDAAGNELWYKSIGTTSNDLSNAVAVDAFGNVYISGLTEGSLGGPLAGSSDAFLTKIDPLGNELWSTQIGGPSSDNSFGVAVDAAGNAYISGITSVGLDGLSTGGPDAFLAKYDLSGNKLWATEIGSVNYDKGSSVAVDAAGNAYISGDTSGSLGGSNAGGWDAFLTKFDPTGAELWSIQIGTAGYDHSYSVALDATGNTYISGGTQGNLGGPNAGDYDAFLTKFVIPEPASLVLLVVGTPALLRRR